MVDDPKLNLVMKEDGIRVRGNGISGLRKRYLRVLPTEDFLRDQRPKRRPYLPGGGYVVGSPRIDYIYIESGCVETF